MSKSQSVEFVDQIVEPIQQHIQHIYKIPFSIMSANVILTCNVTVQCKILAWSVIILLIRYSLRDGHNRSLNVCFI